MIRGKLYVLSEDMKAKLWRIAILAFNHNLFKALNIIYKYFVSFKFSVFTEVYARKLSQDSQGNEAFS